MKNREDQCEKGKRSDSRQEMLFPFDYIPGCELSSDADCGLDSDAGGGLGSDAGCETTSNQTVSLVTTGH